MPTIELTTHINAPRERVFDLARSVDLHMASTASSKEGVVGGVTSGLMELGETVTWRARHFGLWHQLTSEITQFSRPDHFRVNRLFLTSYLRTLLEHRNEVIKDTAESDEWPMYLK